MIFALEPRDLTMVFPQIIHLTSEAARSKIICSLSQSKHLTFKKFPLPLLAILSPYLDTNSGFPVLKEVPIWDFPHSLHLYLKSNFLIGLLPAGNGLG